MAVWNFSRKGVRDLVAGVILCAVLMCFCLGAGGCGQKEEGVPALATPPTESPKPAPPSPSPSPAPTEDLTNKAVNSLTGLYIDKVAAARRPVAVVINNIHIAKPQSGISQADIIYEVLAEGDITRLEAVFRDFDSEKIGPVRSTRHYFLDFALDHDAIFVHHGGSPLGYSEMKRLGLSNLDGMREADTFWRDPERSRIASMYEHSSYTSAANILLGLETHDYRVEAFEDEDAPFEFYDEETQPENATPAAGLTVPFSTHYHRLFEYDPVEKAYAVFQGDDPHIDEETGEQLAMKNVIVQYVNMYIIAGDAEGRREVDMIGTGDGLLLTNGAAVPITWEKAEHKSPTRWFDEEGNKLTLNKGNSWINVFMGDVELREPEDTGWTPRPTGKR